eukprot:357315-Chlamydomonas_euryale.AAC.2
MGCGPCTQVWAADCGIPVLSEVRHAELERGKRKNLGTAAPQVSQDNRRLSCLLVPLPHFPSNRRAHQPSTNHAAAKLYAPYLTPNTPHSTPPHPPEGAAGRAASVQRLSREAALPRLPACGAQASVPPPSSSPGGPSAQAAPAQCVEERGVECGDRGGRRPSVCTASAHLRVSLCPSSACITCGRKAHTFGRNPKPDAHRAGLYALPHIFSHTCHSKQRSAPTRGHTVLPAAPAIACCRGAELGSERRLRRPPPQQPPVSSGRTHRALSAVSAA